MAAGLRRLLAILLCVASPPRPTLASIRIIVGACSASGYLTGTSADCSDNCCAPGVKYPQYRCSPRVNRRHTDAVMFILTSSPSGGTSCNGSRYDGDAEPVVTLSTGWYKERCGRRIAVQDTGGNAATASVVGECDSVNGCGSAPPPCGHNYVMASPAVWRALGRPQSQWSELEVTWSDEPI